MESSGFPVVFYVLHALAADKTPIGQVIASIGTVKAISPDKSERTLRRGDPIYVLDVIVVDAASKVQLKFSDGGIINLIASTEYRVDSYVFKDPNKNSEAVSTLVKGGFRMISGLIAKENPIGAQIKTPLATMGLRGTIVEAALANSKLSVGCEEGKVVVSNGKGEIEIGPGSNTLYAVVSEGKAPMPSKEKPLDLAAASFNIEGREPSKIEGREPTRPQPLKEPSVTVPEAPRNRPTRETAPEAEIPRRQAPAEEYGNYQVTPNLSNLNLEEIPYEAETEGYAYDESRTIASLIPAITVGTVSIVGIIAVATLCRHEESSTRSCSYSKCREVSSSSYSRCRQVHHNSYSHQ